MDQANIKANLSSLGFPKITTELMSRVGTRFHVGAVPPKRRPRAGLNTLLILWPYLRVRMNRLVGTGHSLLV